MNKKIELQQSTKLSKTSETMELSVTDMSEKGEGTTSPAKESSVRTEVQREGGILGAKGAAAQKNENHSLLGTVIDGRYEVERCLGVGAMGSVFLVRHLRLEKMFALKMVNPELAERKEFVARFEREANACSRLDHPNCISVTDFGHTRSGHLYLVMEYVDGVSLSDLVHQKSVSLKDAFEYIRQVLLGLEHAHGKGLIHRDIKLENVIRCSRGTDDVQIKILDFGMAKSPEKKVDNLAITRKGVVLGTPQYMAPEQLRNQPTDERSDLYSVGVTLFRLITGTVVFAGDTMIDVFASKLTRPAPSLKEVTSAEYPAPLELFLRKALQRNPNERFATAAEMLDALEQVEREIFGSISRSPMADSENSGEAVAGASEFWRTIFDHPIDDAVYWYTCGRSPRRANWKNRIHGLFHDRVGKMVLLRFILIVSLASILFLAGALYFFSDDIVVALEDRVRDTKFDFHENVSAPPAVTPSETEAPSSLPPPETVPPSEKKSDAVTASAAVDSASPDSDSKSAQLSENVEPQALLESRLLIEQKKCRLAESKLMEYIDMLGKKPAMGYLLLGRAQICLRRPRKAMEFYKHAIDLEDRYRFDAGILDDIKKMVSKNTARNKSLDFMIEVLGDAALPTLIQYAGHQQQKEVRHRARDYVEAVGALEHVNMEASFDWDLNQTGDCKEKRKIVSKLAALGTNRAKQILKRARDSEVRVNLFRKRYKHECVRNDIIKAIATMGISSAAIQ